MVWKTRRRTFKRSPRKSREKSPTNEQADDDRNDVHDEPETSIKHLPSHTQQSDTIDETHSPSQTQDMIDRDFGTFAEPNKVIHSTFIVSF